jgi:hypothetical protein
MLLSPRGGFKLNDNRFTEVWVRSGTYHLLSSSTYATHIPPSQSISVLTFVCLCRRCSFSLRSTPNYHFQYLSLFSSYSTTTAHLLQSLQMSAPATFRGRHCRRHVPSRTAILHEALQCSIHLIKSWALENELIELSSQRVRINTRYTKRLR